MRQYTSACLLLVGVHRTLPAHALENLFSFQPVFTRENYCVCVFHMKPFGPPDDSQDTPSAPRSDYSS